MRRHGWRTVGAGSSGRDISTTTDIYTPDGQQPADRPELCKALRATTRDRELARRLLAGDEHALREIYREHAPAVLGLARRVVANEAIAEEVGQDVFVRFWEAPDRFDPERGTIRAFLLANTHSRAVERVRAEDSQRRRYEVLGRQPVSPTEDDPGRELLTRDVQTAVRAALAALPDDQRVAIEMAYYEGLSYRDVADALAEPEGTVKYRIRTGMFKMRAALQAGEVVP